MLGRLARIVARPQRARRAVSPVVGVCVALTAALLWAPAARAEPAPESARSPGAGSGVAPARTGALEAPDEYSAMRLAYRTRARVEILPGRTETARTFANPDGTLSLEQFAVPQRVRRGAGWVPVSTRLTAADGAVVPEATVADLRFSAGGTGPLVRIGRPGAQVSMWWPGPLPAPALHADTATYAEVLPGVDLVLRADVDSFREVLVVKSRHAAAHPMLKRLAFRITADALTLRQDADGVVTAVDASGSAVFASDGAAMWDSPSPVARRVDGGSSEATAAAADRVPHRAEPVPVRLSDGELVLAPAPQMLADPATVFPLYIDPSFNGGNEIWTHVSRKWPDRSYWTDDNRTSIRVGQVWQSTYDDDWRAFVQFNTGVLGHATIHSASFLIKVDHTAGCAPTPVGLWHAGLISTSSAVTWNNTATKWYRGAPLQTVSVAANEASCPQTDRTIEFGNANVKDLMQDTASANNATVTFGLRAPDETDHYQWKKFAPGSAYLDVVYNHPPAKPGPLAIDSCFLMCGSPAVVRSGTPAISARVSDPNGGTLRVEYEVFNSAKTTLLARSGTTVTGVPSGSARSWPVTPSLPEGTYHWRAKACDTYVCGVYSDWFTFTVDTNDLSLPTVSATPYLEKSTGTWNGGVGTPGAFTFGPNGGTGVVQYRYSVNGGAVTAVGAGTPQAERLSLNQQQVSTDLAGFSGINATLTRATDRGHDSGQSLAIAPAAVQTAACGVGCTFAAVGGDAGGMRLGMQAGRRYRATGWIFVPAATGLSVPNPASGLRIGIYYKVGTTYAAVWSPPATVVGAWQRLEVSAQLPTGATEAFLRLFNGFSVGQTTKVVYWDDLSVRELVGDTTVESITPTRDGLNTLSVHAVDLAGNPSDPRIYQFLVRPTGDLTWYWSLDENTGTAAASAPTNNRPAAFAGSGTTWLAPGRVGTASVTMAGGGELSTASPVLDTSHPAGFSVAAWVRLTDLAGRRSAVSQDGVNTSLFRLGFRPDRDVTGDGVADAAWCFTVKTADTAAAGEAAACTGDFVVPGDWVHVVGILDPSSGKVKLYVNGTAQIGGSYAEAAFAGGWAATGQFAIGRGWQDAAPADRWIGDIDEVYAAQEVWNDAEIDFRAIQ